MHQKDYFDNLYRKTTASYRAKVDAASEGRCSSQQRSASRDRKARKDTGDSENDSKRTGKGDECHAKPSGVLKERNAQRNSQRHDTKTKSTAAEDPNRRSRDPRQLTLIRRNQTECGSSEKGTESASTKPTMDSCASRPSRTTAKTSNAMWIRPRSKTPHSNNGRRKVMDPVQLYQYYQNEWAKFKTNLPGENSRSELRWQIRYKLLGE